ncbi:hypothetical protein AAG906_035153 [Vitis piasezkii]
MEHSKGFEVHKSVSEKRNLTLIDEMANFLVDQLMEQMHKRKKIGGVFTKTAYTIVAREIGENFELGYFYVAQKVLQSGSGFGFNESTQMIEATTEVWTTYTKAHPRAFQLRYKPIRNYDKLFILLGKDRPTEVSVGMNAVVAALDRSNLQNYTEDQLFEEISKIGGMSDVSHMKAYQALTSDVSATRAFLACAIDRHKLWLLLFIPLLWKLLFIHLSFQHVIQLSFQGEWCRFCSPILPLDYLLLVLAQTQYPLNVESPCRRSKGSISSLFQEGKKNVTS